MCSKCVKFISIPLKIFLKTTFVGSLLPAVNDWDIVQPLAGMYAGMKFDWAVWILVTVARANEG